MVSRRSVIDGYSKPARRGAAARNAGNMRLPSASVRRAVGACTATVNAVAMSGGEIVPAAQRGVLDAAKWIGPADDLVLGFHTVFNHCYLQGLHQSTDVGELLLNKTTWNELTSDMEAIVEASAMATVTESYT